MALTDYTIDTSGTPQDVLRRQKLADALMQRGADSSPAAGGPGGGWITALNRGLAGALSGYQRGQADQMDRSRQQSERDLLGSYPGANPVASAGTVPAVLSNATPAADTSGKIYSNDEPSPLDPPSGDDRKKMIATILGEENTPQGQAGVANVIRNRAVDGSYGGDTPSAVVTAKSQFEPWSTEAGRARMAAALRNPAQVAAADNAIKMAYGEGGQAPNDPTEGKTMFYAPAAQAALGRPAPSWAQGEGQKLGNSLFYDDNSTTPANAQPAQGQLPVQVAQADPQAARKQELLAWARNAAISQNPSIRQMGIQTLESLQKQDSYTQETDKNGNIWSVNRQTGERKVALKADDKSDPNAIKVLGKDGELYHIGPDGKPVIDHKNQSDVGPGMSDEAIDFAAKRAIAGDTKALVGLGRGNQGRETLVKINERIANLMKDDPNGAKTILDNVAQQAGLVSSSRALGTKETHFGVAEKAMEESLPIAQAASDAVPRTDWVHVNKLIQAGQTEHASPTLKRFLIATDTAAKDYARTINPTGALRESDIEYARKILSTSDGPEAYKQALDQLRIEAGVMHRAIQRQKDELHGKKPAETTAAPTAPSKGPPQVGEVVKGHKFLGGDPANPASWSKVDSL